MESDGKQRRRLRAAFENWVTTWPGTPPVVLPALSSNANSATYALAGVAREIVIWVTRGISVGIVRGDVCWDMLLDLDVWPERQADGQWKCAYPDCTNVSSYPSAEALLQDHLFDPLADWIQNTLRPARWLELYGSGGITWASLAEDSGTAPPSLAARFRVHDVE